jgi:putative oxidoreductase
LESSCGGRAAVGLLVVRLVIGSAIVLHGWPKIQNTFGWMGAESRVPGFFQALAALSEFGGGLALILGLFTPLAAFGIACTMIGALTMVHFPRGDPFVARGGGASFEHP